MAGLRQNYGMIALSGLEESGEKTGRMCDQVLKDELCPSAETVFVVDFVKLRLLIFSDDVIGVQSKTGACLCLLGCWD